MRAISLAVLVLALAALSIEATRGGRSNQFRNVLKPKKSIAVAIAKEQGRIVFPENPHVHPAGFRKLPNGIGNTFRTALHEDTAPKSRLSHTADHYLIHALALLAQRSRTLLGDDPSSTATSSDPSTPVGGGSVVDSLEGNRTNLVAEAKKEEEEGRSYDVAFHYLSHLFDDFFTSQELRVGLSQERIAEFVKLAKEHSLGLSEKIVERHAKQLTQLLKELTEVLSADGTKDPEELFGLRYSLNQVLQSLLSKTPDLKHERIATEHELRALAYLINVLEKDRSRLLSKLKELENAGDDEQKKLVEAFIADLSLALAAEPNEEKLLKLERDLLEAELADMIEAENKKDTTKDSAEAKGEAKETLLRQMGAEGRVEYCNFLRNEAKDKPRLTDEMVAVIDCFCDPARPFMQCSAEMHLVVSDVIVQIPDMSKIMNDPAAFPEVQAAMKKLEKAHMERTAGQTSGTAPQKSGTKESGCGFGVSVDVLGGSCDTGMTCSTSPEICMDFGCGFPAALPVIQVSGGGCVVGGESPSFYLFIDLSICVPAPGAKDAFESVGLSPCLTLAKISFYPLHGYFTIDVQIPFIVSVKFQARIQAYRAISSLCSGAAQYTELHCVMVPGDWQLKVEIGIQLFFISWWWTVWEYGAIPVVCPAAPKKIDYPEVKDLNRQESAGGVSVVGTAEVDPEYEQFSMDYVNNWDGPVNFECQGSHVVTGMFSMHHNGYEDRRWKFICSEVTSYETYNCEWTSYVNNFDELMDRDCPESKVIAGINSYHDNGFEDRRFQFKCCNVRSKADLRGRRLFDCNSNTEYINDLDGCMAAKVRPDSVLIGLHSIHNDGCEDRQYKFRFCYVDPQNYVSTSALQASTEWVNDFTVTSYRTSFDTTSEGYFLYNGVLSDHSNQQEDRTWNFRRQRPTSFNFDPNSCTTTTQNNADAEMDVQCPANKVVAGIRSWYQSGNNDRIYVFVCCGLTGNIQVGQVVSQGFSNGYDGRIDVNYSPLVLVGMSSQHHNGYEDRVFSWKTASLTVGGVQAVEQAPIAPFDIYYNKDQVSSAPLNINGQNTVSGVAPNEIRFSKTDNACSVSCTNQIACTHWVRSPSMEKCWLMTGPVTQTNYWVGDRNLGVRKEKCTVEYGRDQTNGNRVAEKTFVFSDGACCQYCSNDGSCTHWVRSPSLSICWLLSGTPQLGGWNSDRNFGYKATSISVAASSNPKAMIRDSSSSSECPYVSGTQVTIPNGYNINWSCTYLLQGTGTVSFGWSSTELNYDFVTVFSNSNSQLLRHSGQSGPPSVSGSDMRLIFTSDSSVTGSGFTAYW